MAIVFDGRLNIDYSQAYVLPPASFGSPSGEEMFAGQSNGLCGAGVDDHLMLTVGAEYGLIPFTVEVLEEEPGPAAEKWQDVVEVSLRTTTSAVTLTEWGDSACYPIPLGSAGWYRVRYCAHDFDGFAHPDDDAVNEGYLLQFWPAPAAFDRVVRVSGPRAQQWHDHAGALPAASLAERDEAARRRRETAAARRMTMAHKWGGRVPSERLDSLHGNVIDVARIDRDLLDDMAGLDAATQRQAARFLTRRAYEHAGLADHDWAAAGLTAMDRGDVLPPPFSDLYAVQALVGEAVGRPADAVGRSGGACPTTGLPASAVPAIFGAVHPDPLQALVDAFSHAAATFAGQRSALVAELRTRFMT